MKLVILDRDGVINYEYADQALSNIHQLVPIPGSLAAIAALKQAGFTVVVATNQSKVNQQLITTEELQLIHADLQDLLITQYQVSLDEIVFCPHIAVENCNCRKPKPGMLAYIGSKYSVDFQRHRIPFVGDAITDLVAAKAIGALPVLVKTGKGLDLISKVGINNLPTTLIFDDLNHFVKYWLEQLN